MRQFRYSQPSGTARLHSGQRMTPFRWAPQEPTKVATVSQFAAPRDGEASLWSACGSSPLGLPGAHESGDSFAVRSPQRRRCLILIRVGRHAGGPPRSKRRWRQFRSSQPPGTARPHSDMRITSLRWTRQQPTNVATVSHFAAPQGRRGLILICASRHPAGPASSHRKWRPSRCSQPPRDSEVSI